MSLSERDIWTVIHGMGLGAIFLLAFGGGLAGLYSLRPTLVTPLGAAERARRLKIGMWLLCVISWATVFSGTWLIYIWYRAKPVAGEELAHFPRSFLLSKPETKEWHEFGMEWKEHVAWLVPMIATSVAFVVQYYGRRLVAMPAIRKSLMWLLTISFGAAGVAGVFGAFINKVAATR